MLREDTLPIRSSARTISPSSLPAVSPVALATGEVWSYSDSR